MEIFTECPDRRSYCRVYEFSFLVKYLITIALVGWWLDKWDFFYCFSYNFVLQDFQSFHVKKSKSNDQMSK